MVQGERQVCFTLSLKETKTRDSDSPKLEKFNRGPISLTAMETEAQIEGRGGEGEGF